MEQQKLDPERSADRKSQVGLGDRSERIRTTNVPRGRLTDQSINVTLNRLDKFIPGEARNEVVDALTTEHQATLLAAQDGLATH